MRRSGLGFQHLGMLLVAVQLGGCGCGKQMEVYFTPNHHILPSNLPQRITWLDPQTLELELYADLRPPTDVDPRRFALTRYNVTFDGDANVCSYEVCYRELDGAEAVPESLSWDPAEPKVLRLHFAEPIPSSRCDEWGNRKAEVHALELIYLGGNPSDDIADPDVLAYTSGPPMPGWGAHEAGTFVNCHQTEENCEYDLCVDRSQDGNPSLFDQPNLWVDCP